MWLMISASQAYVDCDVESYDFSKIILYNQSFLICAIVVRHKVILTWNSEKCKECCIYL